MVLVGGHEIFFLCDYTEKTVGKKLRYNPFSPSVVRWTSFSVSLLGRKSMGSVRIRVCP